MRNTMLMTWGIVGFAVTGGCSLPLEDGDREYGERAADTPATSAREAASASGDWQFRYDEVHQEVTARRGGAVLVYPLRDMGAEGARMITSFKGHDGATWTLPNDDSSANQGAEEVGQSHDPVVVIGPPPRVATPPVYGAGSRGGASGHGPPPGWNSANWGKACRIAAAMAGVAGCAAITAQCAVGTAITVGTVVIPCSLFIAFACTATNGAATAYMEGCPK
uniref:Lipoprotein n=1 Tax=Aetherobacter sp. TaxID=2022431 RepID=A0A3Q8I1Q1_9BACT|nr:hypothetical protein [Aetherobacter sp.]